MAPRIGIITNPRSRKNRDREHRRAILDELVGNRGLVRQTQSTDEIAPALEELVAAGVQYWVADGGDGTLHWMLNEGRAALRPGAAPTLVPTNRGTVDFVANKAGIRGDADDVIRGLMASLDNCASPQLLELDTLEVTGRRPGDPPGGLPFRRLGFGTALGGIGQRFFSRYYAEPVQGGRGIARVIGKTVIGLSALLPGVGHLGLVPTALREHAAYLTSPAAARVVADGHEFAGTPFRGLHAGSINVDVATVELFPNAAEAGQLHFDVGDVSPLATPFCLLYLLMGQPVRARGWHELAGRRLQVWARGDELLDPVIDGERYFGFEQLEVTLGPRVSVPTLRQRPS